jgi:hypothetical protein
MGFIRHPLPAVQLTEMLLSYSLSNSSATPHQATLSY